MDHVLIGPLTSVPSVNTCERRWVEEPEQWTGDRRFIFLLPLSCASHSLLTLCKMLRSPGLAHKAPVMQAITCVVKFRK